MSNIVNFPDQEAQKKWGTIPPANQQMLLKNVWCSQCSSVTEVKETVFENISKDLLIKGFCKKCKHNVARLVEMS